MEKHYERHRQRFEVRYLLRERLLEKLKAESAAGDNDHKPIQNDGISYSTERKEGDHRVTITEWKRADFSAVGEAAARAPRGCSEHKEPQQSWLSPSRAAPRAPLQQRDPGVPQAAASSLRAAEMKGILQKT